jgi:hypothetical protein
MGKIAAYLLVGIGAGLGFAYWQGMGRSGDVPGAHLAGEDRAPLERRLSELETSLALERYERQALADELESLRTDLRGLPVTADAADAAGASTGSRLRNQRGNEEARDENSGRVRVPDGPPQDRDATLRQRQIDRFIAAGLTPDRAAWIIQREEELQLEALQARYQASRNGVSPEEVANLTPTSLLREELDDADYEKYLAGRGRPTTINVREVLPSSQAQAAGLQAGDEIVTYNGKRVFDIGELTELTFQASPGQTVPLEVVRDGQRIQVYVAGGPIGISGGGRSTRRDFDGGR